MGKAKKKKVAGTGLKIGTNLKPAPTRRLRILLALGGAVALIFLGMYIYGIFPSKGTEGRNFQAQERIVRESGRIRLKETRKTLPSDLFSGPTAKVYRIAQLIPQVIDSIYCYCFCDKTFGHKSLLSCYVDDHSAKCDICQKETFHAYYFYQKGLNPGEISKKIDEMYQ